VLRLVAGHAPQAPTTPFVLLVLSLLGGGLVALLLLSSASSADAFTQRNLQRDNQALSLREQQLARDVAASEAPGELAKRAQKLGLVEGAEPGFLVVEPNGRARVKGSPVPATSPPPPPKPTPSPTPKPSGTPSGSPTAARPGTQPSGTPTPRVAPSAGPTPKTTPKTTPTPTTTPTPGGTR
jgi:type II secretory pathway pseudopilin PulG